MVGYIIGNGNGYSKRTVESTQDSCKKNFCFSVFNLFTLLKCVDYHDANDNKHDYGIVIISP